MSLKLQGSELTCGRRCLTSADFQDRSALASVQRDAAHCPSPPPGTRRASHTQSGHATDHLSTYRSIIFLLVHRAFRPDQSIHWRRRGFLAKLTKFSTSGEMRSFLYATTVSTDGLSSRNDLYVTPARRKPCMDSGTIANPSPADTRLMIV